VPRTALLVGASGLVGGRLLHVLLDDPAYERVMALVRRGLPVRHKKLVQREIAFDLLADLGNVPRAHVVFCCLGTTMKKAGSRAAFSRVDLDYVRELARLASAAGAAQFLLVSALGADPRSRVFYNRVKGEAEEAVKQTRFDGIHIFRPSLLVGNRPVPRPAERIVVGVARILAPILVGALRKYRPIAAETVARAMVSVAHEARKGVHVYPSDRIQTLGVQP
jgi:uncharacterized protein YbjT (DUF2867 family)